MDQNYMQKALDLAALAAEQGEVPIGALLVRDGAVIVESGNTREIQQNPLGHAEHRVIQEASQLLKTWRLENTTLYVTTEPCLMCTGLIYAARIPKVVFGCKNPKGGSLLYIEERRKELGLNHSVEIVSGVMEKECGNLLTDFFRKKRP
jgi:tRNA(adenine34) deaminase